MSSKYVATGGFRDKCKSFFAAKGVLQPSCSDNGCWEHFFLKNPAKVASAALAFEKFGEEPIIKVQGQEYAMQVEARESFEIRAGLRKARSNYALIARARGKRYVRHLSMWLQNHPIPVNTSTAALGISEYAQEVA